MPKTFMLKTAEIKRAWLLVDAKDQILGQVATNVAKKLMGKEKVTFTPHIDNGDYVVVVNAGLVQVSGRKGERKMYYDHSKYPGGLRERSYDEISPAEAITRAVHNMLPKNRLRKDRMSRLKVYLNTEHKHPVGAVETQQ